MSAFLGPIHSWLFRKITMQNELTERLINRVKSEGCSEQLMNSLDHKYGVLEKGELAEIIDESNIHGWLQDRVSLVEKRLAAAVTLALRDTPECVNALVDEAECYGEAHAPYSEIDPKGMYEYLEAVLLNGMPCDHVNVIIVEDDVHVIWKESTDIHKSYWDMTDGDVANYYLIRNAVIKGMLSQTSLQYTETDVRCYQLSRRR